ncbi:V-type ATPase subunit a family protein, partial [Pseudomonas fluorescens]|nr:V-type ATPase subunit a family protein [Pseudomonas fluorescens]
MFRRRSFRFRRQGQMSSRSQVFSGTVAIAALLSMGSPSFAQSDDDPEMRIERLENQLRQLTGQNEELQYRNRQLEERLRAVEGGAQGAAPGQAPRLA